MSDSEKKIVIEVLNYLSNELVNEIDNNAQLEEPEACRLAQAIKDSVENTKNHFSQ